MRKPDGFSITLSPFRRPTLETAPVDAKSGCLYPNNARAMFEAKSRGFDNCIVCDMLGNVAELANSNVFMAKDGVVFTPMPNGTFLNGITRQRLIKLLRADGVSVVETVLRYRGLRERRRDFRDRQRVQGAADHPHRRARRCSPARSTARRASFTGPMRTASADGLPEIGAVIRALLLLALVVAAGQARAQDDDPQAIYAAIEPMMRSEFEAEMAALIRDSIGHPPQTRRASQGNR